MLPGRAAGCRAGSFHPGAVSSFAGEEGKVEYLVFSQGFFQVHAHRFVTLQLRIGYTGRVAHEMGAGAPADNFFRLDKSCISISTFRAIILSRVFECSAL